MKRIEVFGILIVVSLFLIGFTSAIRITGYTAENGSVQSSNVTSNNLTNQGSINATDNLTNQNNFNNTPTGTDCGAVSEDSRDQCCKDLGYDSWSEDKRICEGSSNSTENEDNQTEQEHSSVGSANVENETERHHLTEEQKRELITERNRLRFEDKTGFTCPNNCTCEGSTVKCLLPNGGRELTIYAGESGNIIVQVQGENMTTNVTLYKANNGKIYAVNKDNNTKEVNLLPDQVKEKIRERLSRQLGDETISLDENGTYQYQGEDNARLFAIFPVKVAVQAQLDSTTGQIVELKKPWWAFLAKDESQQLVGASCGTVTPGYNNQCCQTKGYNFWNATAAECQFSN